MNYDGNILELEENVEILNSTYSIIEKNIDKKDIILTGGFIPIIFGRMRRENKLELIVRNKQKLQKIPHKIRKEDNKYVLKSNPVDIIFYTKWYGKTFQQIEEDTIQLQMPKNTFKMIKPELYLCYSIDKAMQHELNKIFFEDSYHMFLMIKEKEDEILKLAKKYRVTEKFKKFKQVEINNSGMTNLEILLNTVLDKFEEENVKYSIVSGFVASQLYSGRETDDVDIIIENLDKNKSKTLVNKIKKENLQFSPKVDKIEAGIPIRIHEKGNPLQNIELKVADDREKRKSLKNRFKYNLNGREIWIGDPEMLVAYKIYMAHSEESRDFEDAVEIYKEFSDRIDLSNVERIVNSHFKSGELFKPFKQKI